MKKLLALVALVAVAGSVQANTVAWINSTDTNWDGANWYNVETPANTGMPVAGDSAYIDSDYTPFGLPILPAAMPVISSTVSNVALFMISPFYSAQVTIADGGSIGVDSLTRIGHGDVNAGSGITATLNMTGGYMVSALIQLGYNENDGTNTLAAGHGVVNMSGDAVLHAGTMSFGQEMGAYGFDANAIGTGQINMTDSAFFLVNGDVTAEGATWVGSGMISATGAGESISYIYNSVDARTEFTVIPEPATFGLMALLGGGMLWIRKRFTI